MSFTDSFYLQYRDLDQLRTRYPDVPIMALTATARKNTVADIMKRLKLKDCAFLSQSFNRPNLRYIIEPKSTKWLESMMDFISSNHPNKSGVIYCLGRDKCEEVAKKLEDRGFSARHFHAGMTPADKDRTLDEWRSDRVHIIVATVRGPFSIMSMMAHLSVLRSRLEWELIKPMVLPRLFVCLCSMIDSYNQCGS
jgi:superfamily II DNA helicase RecQ